MVVIVVVVVTNCVDPDQIPLYAVYNLDLHCSQVFNLTDTRHTLINAHSLPLKKNMTTKQYIASLARELSQRHGIL